MQYKFDGKNEEEKFNVIEAINIYAKIKRKRSDFPDPQDIQRSKELISQLEESKDPLHILNEIIQIFHLSPQVISYLILQTNLFDLLFHHFMISNTKICLAILNILKMTLQESKDAPQMLSKRAGIFLSNILQGVYINSSLYILWFLITKSNEDIGECISQYGILDILLEMIHAQYPYVTPLADIFLHSSKVIKKSYANVSIEQTITISEFFCFSKFGKTKENSIHIISCGFKGLSYSIKQIESEPRNYLPEEFLLKTLSLPLDEKITPIYSILMFFNSIYFRQIHPFFEEWITSIQFFEWLHNLLLIHLSNDTLHALLRLLANISLRPSGVELFIEKGFLSDILAIHNQLTGSKEDYLILIMQVTQSNLSKFVVLPQFLLLFDEMLIWAEEIEANYYCNFFLNFLFVLIRNFYNSIPSDYCQSIVSVLEILSQNDDPNIQQKVEACMKMIHKFP